MSNIVEYDIAFRSPADFAADAERRRWLESPKGQFVLEKCRVWEERLHLAAMIRSSEYSDGQGVIECLLRGETADFSGVSLITAEQAMRKYLNTQAQKAD